jgi:hypothetical protein
MNLFQVKIRTKCNVIVALLIAVFAITSCAHTKSDEQLHAEAETLLRSAVPEILGDWNYAKWKEYARRRWRTSHQGPFEFVGKVTRVTPGPSSSRLDRLEGQREEYFPKTGSTQEVVFKSAAEQLGPLEKIEQLEMGQRMDNLDVYKVDSLMTAKFKNQRAYIYCIIYYIKDSGEGIQISELVPYRFKIATMYITPLPRIMEKRLRTQWYGQNSVFQNRQL